MTKHLYSVFVLATDSLLPRNWTNSGCEEAIRTYACYLHLCPSPTYFHLLLLTVTNGVDRCELVFENCFVPEENVLGKEGKGLSIASVV